jgi:hypothetical protein
VRDAAHHVAEAAREATSNEIQHALEQHERQQQRHETGRVTKK